MKLGRKIFVVMMVIVGASGCKLLAGDSISQKEIKDIIEIGSQDVILNDGSLHEHDFAINDCEITATDSVIFRDLNKYSMRSKHIYMEKVTELRRDGSYIHLSVSRDSTIEFTTIYTDKQRGYHGSESKHYRSEKFHVPYKEDVKEMLKLVKKLAVSCGADVS